MDDPLPKDLYDAFLQTAADHGLWGPRDRLLVAVSGGPDSVVLADLTRRTGQLAGLVHVNYHLRGQESDADQDLVQRLARRWEVPFLGLQSSPEELASRSKQSTQMAARAIRYDWWEKLIASGAGSLILTAHHADDQMETIILHWLRGTGMTGWMGIPMKREFIRRPLLAFRKAALIDYAQWASLPFRTDLSNLDTEYRRNQVRHRVVPELLAIQPDLHHLADLQAKDALHTLQAAEWAVQSLEKQAVTRGENEIRIDLNLLKDIPWAPFALFTWLHALGFNRDQLRSIQSLEARSHGQHFASTIWEAVLDRGHLVCRKKNNEETHEPVIITRSTRTADAASGRVEISTVTTWTEADLDNPNILLLDPGAVAFPLILRTWAAGDRIKLPGLKGRKKIREILAEHRIDPFRKQDAVVLCTSPGGEIIWLPGYRISAHLSLPVKGERTMKLEWMPDQV